MIQKIFHLRICDDTVFKNRERPCILYQIKRCSGPCVGYIKENEYNVIIIGHVLGLNINDEYIKDGIIDIKKLKPLARLGYMDYSVVDNFFKMNRPK